MKTKAEDANPVSETNQYSCFPPPLIYEWYLTDYSKGQLKMHFLFTEMDGLCIEMNGGVEIIMPLIMLNS